MKNIDHLNNVKFCRESYSPDTYVNQTHQHPSKYSCGPSTPPCGDSTPQWQSPPAGQCAPPQNKHSSGMTWGTWQKGQSIDQASEFPISSRRFWSCGWSVSMWTQDWKKNQNKKNAVRDFIKTVSHIRDCVELIKQWIFLRFSLA